MKICIFTQNLGNYISGGRWYPWFIAHCLSKVGNEVTIFTKTNPVFDRDFNNFCDTKPKILVQNYYGTREQASINIMSSCDLIIGFPADSLDYAVTVAKAYRKKVVGFIYEPINMLMEFIDNGVEINFNPEDQVWIDFMKQIVRTDIIVCSNRTCVDYAKKLYPNYKGKIVSLFNGINTKIADMVEIKKPEERENAIAYVSRTVKYKGFGDIAYIFSQTKIKPKIYFITGFLDKMDKAQKAFFEDCQKIGIDIEKKVLCTDLEKFEILSKVKALFFPSRFEGFGLPPAEAFHLKTPVVCYGLPIIRECYGDYPFYLDLEDLSRGIEVFDELLENNELLFSKTEKAKEYVDSFATIENFTANLIKAIKGEEMIITRNTSAETKDGQLKLINVLIEGNSGSAAQSLKEQTCLDFLQKEDLDSCNSKYVALCDSRITLSPKALENAAIALETSGADIVYGSSSDTADKKYNSVDYCYESFVVNPFLFGFVMGKTEKMKECLKQVDMFWNVTIGIKGCKMKWKNVRKTLFTFNQEDKFFTEEHYNIVALDFSLTQDVYDIRDVVDSKKNKCKFLLETKEDMQIEPTLLMTLARTPNYLKDLNAGLNGSCNELKNVDIVLGHHIPDGKWNEEVLSFVKEKEWGLVKFDGPFNFCKFNNVIFKKFVEPRHKYVIILNDDVILTDGAIKQILSTFRYKKGVGIVGAKLIHTPQDCEKENWKIQHGGVAILQDRLCTHTYRDYPDNHIAANYIREYMAVTFAFVAIDTECYQSVLLDETIPVEFNDIDFCLRALKKGWKIYYNPYAKAFHAESSTRKPLKLIGTPGDGTIFRERHQEVFKKQMLYREMLQLESTGF